MMNARDELIRHVGDRRIKYITIDIGAKYSQGRVHIEGYFKDVLLKLDGVTYHSGYGGQELFGTIWYTDGTWSDREEYDGSEWWEHRSLPVMPIGYGSEVNWMMSGLRMLWKALSKPVDDEERKEMGIIIKEDIQGTEGAVRAAVLEGRN